MISNSSLSLAQLVPEVESHLYFFYTRGCKAMLLVVSVIIDHASSVIEELSIEWSEMYCCSCDFFVTSKNVTGYTHICILCDVAISCDVGCL